MSTAAAGFRRLLEAFDRLGINYMAGGSLASSVHGIPRSTNDIDLIAAIGRRHVAPLIAEVSAEFYIDPPEAIHKALEAGRMFNLIHFASSYKFDIYPLSSEPYQQAAFSRRVIRESPFEEEPRRPLYVATAEDTILAKLAWYKASNQVLERQWSDVLDVARVQGERLDLAYLRQWAGELGVAELLEEALRV